MVDQAADIAIVTVMTTVSPTLFIMTACLVLPQTPSWFPIWTNISSKASHFLFLFLAPLPNRNHSVSEKV